MLGIKYLNAFKKDYKRIVKCGYDIALLENVITLLAEQKTLPEKYCDHALSGNYAGFRNVISRRIGSWYTKFVIVNWY